MDYLEIAKRTMNFINTRKRKESSGLLRMQPKEDLSIMMRSACMQALPGSCVFFWDFTM